MKAKIDFEDIYNIVRQIPVGKVATYGQIGQLLGNISPRVVGWAMNHSHNQIPPVPAHRVVNRLGQLTGSAHFSPPSLMASLLKEEGIKIENNQIIDFHLHLWSFDEKPFT